MFMNAIDKSWIIDDLCREVGVRFFTLFLLSRPPWVGVGGPVWQEERETRHPGGGRGDERTRSDWVSGKRKTPSRRKRGQTRGATWSSVLLFLRCVAAAGTMARRSAWTMAHRCSNYIIFSPQLHAFRRFNTFQRQRDSTNLWPALFRPARLDFPPRGLRATYSIQVTKFISLGETF